MTENPAAPASGPTTSPATAFAGVPVSDYARDAVATIALLVALALPWTLADRGADRVEVVLATAVSLLSLTLPYLARAGALPATWTVHSTRRARAWAGAPIAVVTAVHLVRDVLDGTGVGTGLGLALAGAVIAAMPRAAELGPVELDGTVTRRWRAVLLGGGVLVAVTAVVTLVIFFAGSGADENPALLGPLALVEVVGVVWLLVGGTVRRDEASRLVLVAVGIVLAVLYVFSSGNAVPGLESTHWVRFGFVLLPAVAAVASSPVVGRGTFTRPEAGRSADVWVRAAVRAFDVIVLLAAVVVVAAVVALVATGFDVVPVLRLVLGAVIAVLAVLARRSLSRDASTGHVPAVGGACLIGVLGLVVVVATTGAGDGVDLVDLLFVFGLPAIAAYSLMVPKAVREHFSTAGIGGEPEIDRTQAYEWRPEAPRTPQPVSLPAAPTAAPVHPGAETRRPAEPRRVTSGNRPATPGRGVPSGGPAAAVPSGSIPGVHPAAGSNGVPASDGHPGEQATQTMPPIGSVRPAVPTDGSPSAGLSSSRPAPDRGARPAPGRPAQDRPAQDRPAQGAASGGDATQVIAPATGGRPAGPATGGETQVLAPAVPPRWSAAQALDPATPLADLARIVQEAPQLRPQVAANPSTYPALLDWLGALGDPAVDAALRTRR